MKKIVSIIFSIIIFCSTTSLIYLGVFKYFSSPKVINKYLSNIKITQKVNLRINESNYFIDNVNNTYLDFQNMNLSPSEIEKLEKTSNINTVIQNIFNNKIMYLFNNSKIRTMYKKNELDLFLTKNIRKQKIKSYIIDNDYKIIDFEKRLNDKTIELKEKHISKIAFLFTNNFILLTIISIIISSLVLIIIHKKRFIETISKVMLVSNILIIIELIIIRIMIRFIFQNTIIAYFFNNYLTDYINITTIISICFTFIFIIVISIYDKYNSKNKQKARLGDVKTDEEDFNF
ncbi:MAG: hypothetical protein IKO49_04255 [Bacilli bacterium]|nr:hypothetical protein [Bacilli bacterium]